MTRRLGSGEPSFDRNHTLYLLGDNLGKADAYITAVENLIEQPGVVGRDNDDSAGGDDDDLGRHRNHVAHLIESAKVAVRAAIGAGVELDKHRGEA